MMLAANKLLVATAKLNKTSNGKINDFAQYFDMFWGLVALAYWQKPRGVGYLRGQADAGQLHLLLLRQPSRTWIAVQNEHSVSSFDSCCHRAAAWTLHMPLRLGHITAQDMTSSSSSSRQSSSISGMLAHVWQQLAEFNKIVLQLHILAWHVQHTFGTWITCLVQRW
jgi:hypothetical protein